MENTGDCESMKPKYINQLSTEWLDSDFESIHPEDAYYVWGPILIIHKMGLMNFYIMAFCHDYRICETI